MRSTTGERHHARPAPRRAPGPIAADDTTPAVDPAPEDTGGAPRPGTSDTDTGTDVDTAERPAVAVPPRAVPAADGDGGAPGDGTTPAVPGRRRRRVLVVALVLILAALAVSPLSPVSPFGGESDEHARVPLPDRSVRVTTTTTPSVTGPKLPEAEPAPPTPLTTLPPDPGAAPTPAPGDPATPGAPAPPTVATPGPIEGAGYALAYHDEFAGAAPDPAVWHTAPFGGALPPTIRDGYLTITSTAANDYRWGHVASTGPRTEAEPSYRNPRAWQEGYFEARLRYSDNSWSWPAFWLFSQTKTEAWPGEDCSRLNAEWDMMENGVENGTGGRPANRWYFTALHRNTTDNSDGGYCDTPDEQRIASVEFPDTNLADWHTWAGSWTADQMCTYLDGVQIQCMEPYDSTAQPMQLIFTMQYLSRCDGCGPRPESLEMQVDWVRVWQR